MGLATNSDPTQISTKIEPKSSQLTAQQILTDPTQRHTDMAPNISNSIFQKLSKYIESSNIFTNGQPVQQQTRQKIHRPKKENGVVVEKNYGETAEERRLLEKVGITIQELQQTKIKSQTNVTLDHLTPDEKHEFQKIRRRERSKFTAKAYRSNRKKKYESDQQELKELKQRNRHLIVNVTELMQNIDDKVKLVEKSGSGALQGDQSVILREAATLSNELKDYLAKLEQKAAVDSQQMQIKQQAMSDHEDGIGTDQMEQAAVTQ